MSMSAIWYGLVATAILISMFVIMAIFEHLFKPSPDQFSMPGSGSSSPQEAAPIAKHANPQTVAASSTTYACDMSVVMPGQHYPTYIAQPAPLPLPCPREATYWPSHSHPHHHDQYV